MTLRLKLIAQETVPIEVEQILPEHLCELSLAAIEKREIFLGNRQIPLADLFRVEGDPTDRRIDWEGNLSGVHWIGTKMTSGVMHVEGSVGRHLGSEMRAGEIHVQGSASDWVGGEMHGGLIHVRGDAGHLVGAAYRGAPRGMTGGTILIGRSAGNEIGHTMRRGLIAIGGDIGDLAGFGMLAGSILVFGQCGIRHGAGMKRGTIGLLGPQRPEPLPTFRFGCQYRPPFFPLLTAELHRHGFTGHEILEAGRADLYHGDLLEGGRGEVLLSPEESAA